jgi:hypothetical protein
MKYFAIAGIAIAIVVVVVVVVMVYVLPKNIEPFEDVSGCQLFGSYKVYKCGEEVKVVNLDTASEEQPQTTTDAEPQTETTTEVQPVTTSGNWSPITTPVCPSIDYLRKHPNIKCRRISNGQDLARISGFCPKGSMQFKGQCLIPHTSCQDGYELNNGICYQKCVPPYQEVTQEVEVIDTSSGNPKRQPLTVCMKP